jgi:hypothetical protein
MSVDEGITSRIIHLVFKELLPIFQTILDQDSGALESHPPKMHYHLNHSVMQSFQGVLDADSRYQL